MSEMLTVSESRTISQLNPSARDRVYQMLQALEDNERLDRGDLNRFAVDELEWGGTSVVMDWSSDNGLLRDRIHVIIGERGSIKHAETDRTDIEAKNIKVRFKWSKITDYIERMGV